MRHAIQRRDLSNAPALTLHDCSTANAARPLQCPGLMGLSPATWPIRSAPLPPGTWRETVSQSRRLCIRHRDPLPRRPWSPTLPPHTSPPVPPYPERPRQRATWIQGVSSRLRLLLATLPAAARADAPGARHQKGAQSRFLTVMRGTLRCRPFAPRHGAREAN